MKCTTTNLCQLEKHLHEDISKTIFRHLARTDTKLLYFLMSTFQTDSTRIFCLLKLLRILYLFAKNPTFIVLYSNLNSLQEFSGLNIESFCS